VARRTAGWLALALLAPACASAGAGSNRVSPDDVLVFMPGTMVPGSCHSAGFLAFDGIVTDRTFADVRERVAAAGADGVLLPAWEFGKKEPEPGAPPRRRSQLLLLRCV
jgi:hypothetical protein